MSPRWTSPGHGRRGDGVQHRRSGHFYQALLGGRLLDPEQLQAMHTTVDASDQLGHGAGHGLGLMVLRPGCATEFWGHGGALAGYRTTAFSTKDANRQLVTTIDSRPGFVSFPSGRRCAPGAPDRKSGSHAELASDDYGRFGNGFKPCPKSDAGIRELPLAPMVIESIRRQLPPNSDPDLLVFTGPGGGNGVPVGSRTMLSRYNFRRVYQRAVARAGPTLLRSIRTVPTICATPSRPG